MDIKILELEQVLTYVCTYPANIFGARTPRKKSADLPLDKVIYFKELIFCGLQTKTFLHFTNKCGDQLKKYPFLTCFF
jgi:hypothetical protein